jgi:hypothetical protein
MSMGVSSFTGRSILMLLPILGAAPLRADTGIPPSKESFLSPTRSFELIVDPGAGSDPAKATPTLTLRSRLRAVWSRRPADFEDFAYPVRALVSDDGSFLVFGGASAHNLGDYHEGLRFYRADGKLVRFLSRRDLPLGIKSVSTANWYDARRTRLEGHHLLFFTPCRPKPLVVDVTSGEILEGGPLVAGQGDDAQPPAKQPDGERAACLQRGW